MKKKNVLALFVLTGLLFTSCEKGNEPIAEVQESNTETIVKFQEKSNHFIGQELRSADNLDRAAGWWKKLMKVVGADLTAGLAGAVVGSVVPGLGTGVAAIIGGAGGSLTAGSTLSAPPGGGGGSNPANAYDFVGEEHVNILLNGLTVDSETIFDGEELNNTNYLTYAKAWLVDHRIFSIEEVAGYSLERLRANLIQASDHVDQDMTEVIASFKDLRLLNDEESDILNAYYRAFEASTSFESFLGYSIEAELIITDSDFSAAEKALFLSTMSTTRHDLNYWKDLE